LVSLNKKKIARFIPSISNPNIINISQLLVMFVWFVFAYLPTID